MINAALKQAMSLLDATDMIREIAQTYREDAAELQSAWQDPKAGKIWEIFGRELEAIADKIERMWNEYG